MRLIHVFEEQKSALLFSQLLKNKKITHECEVISNTDWGSENYSHIQGRIWIQDEDDLPLVKKSLQEFLEDPSLAATLLAALDVKSGSPLIDESLTKEKTAKKRLPLFDIKESVSPVTLCLLISCILLFICSFFTVSMQAPFSFSLASPSFATPPLNKLLLYDYPEALEIIDKLVRVYGIEQLQNGAELPFEGRILLDHYATMSYWEGFYPKLVSYFNAAQPLLTFQAPLFEKIRQGELWRLVTPSLLHQNVFHLFFNLLWLAVLGKLIEQKLGSVRYLLLITLIAIFCDTAQYLMSGFNFMGISGVICGMLGFIWARQRVAAWEGYHLMPGTFSFIFFFLMVVLGCQIGIFISQILWQIKFNLPIANTAHLVGGLIGYGLGRFNSFTIKTY